MRPDMPRGLGATITPGAHEIAGSNPASPTTTTIDTAKFSVTSSCAVEKSMQDRLVEACCPRPPKGKLTIQL